MLNAELLAQAIKHVCTAGFFFLAASCKTVGEPATVVSQELDDLDRAGLLDLGEKINRASIGLVSV